MMDNRMANLATLDNCRREINNLLDRLIADINCRNFRQASYYVGMIEVHGHTIEQVCKNLMQTLENPNEDPVGDKKCIK